MDFLRKLIHSFVIISITIKYTDASFVSDQIWVEHSGPVYCTSSSLCIEYCNTRPMQEVAKIYACCKISRTDQTRYPTCHCCTGANSCENFPDAASSCGDCKQVHHKYNLAYVEQQCKRTAKRGDSPSSLTDIWSDPFAKMQPQPRKF